jgi:hypothetical protein
MGATLGGPQFHRGSDLVHIQLKGEQMTPSEVTKMTQELYDKWSKLTLGELDARRREHNRCKPKVMTNEVETCWIVKDEVLAAMIAERERGIKCSPLGA